MPGHWFTALIFVANFWVMGVIVLKMVRAIQAGEFKRNRWAGIRTPTLMASDQAWEKGHRHAAPGLKRLGYASYAFAASQAIAFVLPQSHAETVILTMGLSQCALFVLVLIWVSVKASRAVRG